MCANSRLIARLSAYRFVACCDCCGGIVHLAWDNLTLSLSPQDFASLCSFLDAHPVPPEVGREGFLQARSKAASTRLWVGRVGIHLEQLEWAELRHLCFMAQHSLNQALPQPTASLVRLPN